MNDRLISMRDVLSIIPVTPRTWERWLKAGKTPEYIRSVRQRFWRLLEIKEWIEKNKKRMDIA